MRIGQFVKHFVPDIIHYCVEKDPHEIEKLQDLEYSRKTFGLSSYPFWSKSDAIQHSKRFWTDVYIINGEEFRVNSQWTVKHTEKFKKYLIDKNIATNETLEALEIEVKKESNEELEKKVHSRGRYRGNAIGNAQNLLIRNILSNLGDETFSEKDWQETKKYFDNKCAYCGSKEKLVMEHAIPINKTMLGEHRLGNLIPSCHSCNSKKGSMNFEEFLVDQPKKIQKIKHYMSLHGYEPLIQNPLSEKVSLLLEQAYLDTADVAKRYIKTIELFLDA